MGDISKADPSAQSGTSAFQAASGAPYRRFLADLHETHVFDWYMEVGCRRGKSFAPVRSKTIAVDPVFSIKIDVVTRKPRLYLFQETSDEFFESRFLEKNEIALSLSFLDGMHLYEYLLRDLIATERNSSPDGFIMLHDCCPFDHGMTTRDLDNLPDGPWTGDVWKIIPILQAHRPDLKIDVLDCRTTGLVVLSNLDPESRVLEARYDEIRAEYDAIDIAGFGPARFYDSFEYRSSRDVLKSDFAMFAPAAMGGDAPQLHQKITP